MKKRLNWKDGDWDCTTKDFGFSGQATMTRTLADNVELIVIFNVSDDGRVDPALVFLTASEEDMKKMYDDSSFQLEETVILVPEWTLTSIERRLGVICGSFGVAPPSLTSVNRLAGLEVLQ